MKLKGKLLVAHPLLKGNDFFEKSVILIYEHSIAGASGLILNKPTEQNIRALVDNEGFNYQGPDLIHKGGPVNSRAICLLHTDEWQSSNTMYLKGLSISSDSFMFEKLAMGNEPNSWRMFAGMCGWASGQLEAEIEGKTHYSKLKSWLTIDADESIVFNYDGDKQWNKALELSSQQMINSYF